MNFSYFFSHKLCKINLLLHYNVPYKTIRFLTDMDIDILKIENKIKYNQIYVLQTNNHLTIWIWNNLYKHVHTYFIKRLIFAFSWPIKNFQKQKQQLLLLRAENFIIFRIVKQYYYWDLFLIGNLNLKSYNIFCKLRINIICNILYLIVCLERLTIAGRTVRNAQGKWKIVFQNNITKFSTNFFNPT
jgi:hypothetical protein